MLLATIRNWLRPNPGPDPRLEDALARVEEESKHLAEAVEQAHRRGVFEKLAEVLDQMAKEDSDRIYRRGGRPR